MKNKFMFIAQVDELRPIYSPGDNICPYYLIDRECNVYSEYSGLVLKQVVTENGYKAVSLNTVDGRRIQRKVHRLGMMTFAYFPGCENYQVNHIDGNKFNNVCFKNLEWMLPKDNVRHAIDNDLRKGWGLENNPHASITSQDAITICNMVLQGHSNEEILDIVPSANDSIITQIVLGNTWKGIITEEQVRLMRATRYKVILTDEEKHKICKFYQDNPIINYYNGCKKDHVIRAIVECGINLTDSTFRMAKRLLYKYQDIEITSQYNY